MNRFFIVWNHEFKSHVVSVSVFCMLANHTVIEYFVASSNPFNEHLLTLLKSFKARIYSCISQFYCKVWILRALSVWFHCCDCFIVIILCHVFIVNKMMSIKEWPTVWPTIPTELLKTCYFCCCYKVYPFTVKYIPTHGSVRTSTTNKRLGWVALKRTSWKMWGFKWNNLLSFR